MADHLLPLVLRRVTGPDGHPDVGDVHAVLCGDLAHLRQRGVEIAVHIVGEGLQRRHIDAVHTFLESTFPGITCQFVDDAGECGEGLTRTGRG